MLRYVLNRKVTHNTHLLFLVFSRDELVISSFLDRFDLILQVFSFHLEISYHFVFLETVLVYQLLTLVLKLTHETILNKHVKTFMQAVCRLSYLPVNERFHEVQAYVLIFYFQKVYKKVYMDVITELKWNN